MEEPNNLEPNLDRSDEKLHLSVVSCSVCGGQDILHEEKQGRGCRIKKSGFYTRLFCEK